MKNVLFYGILGLLLALSLLGIGFVILNRWGHEDYIRWGGFSILTVGLFGIFVGESQKHLTELRFWILSGVLLAVHLVLYSAVLLRTEEWRLIWFMPMALEYPVFLYFRKVFVTSHLRRE